MQQVPLGVAIGMSRHTFTKHIGEKYFLVGISYHLLVATGYDVSIFEELPVSLVSCLQIASCTWSPYIKGGSGCSIFRKHS